MPNNPSIRRQSAMQLVDALSPFFGTGLLNEGEVIKHLMQVGFDVKSPERFLNPMGVQNQMQFGDPQGPPPMMGPDGAPLPEGGEEAPPPGGDEMDPALMEIPPHESQIDMAALNGLYA